MNKTKCINLCIKSVEEGSSAAALYLAELFYSGDIVVKNDAVALQYYKLANPKHNGLPAFRLGHFYDQGNVVKCNTAKALYWYETASSLGFATAYLPCATLYWSAYENLNEDRAKMLAKSYLWISAAEIEYNSRDLNESGERNVDSIASLRKAVLNEMPMSWQAGLDKQVAQHFANLKLS